MNSLNSACAQIAVENAAYSFDKPFTYLLGEFADIARPGMRCSVPFGSGNKLRIGMILSVCEYHEDVKKLKLVAEVLDDAPVLIPEMLELAAVMKDKYFCALYEAMRPMCPMVPRIKGNSVSLNTRSMTSKMLHAVRGFSGMLTPRQNEVYSMLCELGDMSAKELAYYSGASASVIKILIKCGAVECYELELYRKPKQLLSTEEGQKFTLTGNQADAYRHLITELGSGKASLLYGVTGSGKTAVFIKLIEYVMANLDGGVIVMVPEISLTSQTVKLFTTTFGDTVAVLHSGLSIGERFDEWRRVKRGEARIVVGTRSAVFAPMGKISLIVVDEEHEHTYKAEASPRYDAREIARWRCGYHKGLCLLSSATPSIESYFYAKNGRYSLNTLHTRFGKATIPNVMLADMNDESQPDSSIGLSLYSEIKENLENSKQSIILLNRRGYHTFISCRSCHEVLTCPNCSISMTYHSANKRLMCHYCGCSISIPIRCPHCEEESLSFRGYGTQKAQEQIEELFSKAKIVRVDADSVMGKLSLEKKLEAFSKGEYDIMIGTQMVAKGLDFENVTLVGVVSADLMLCADDFRSNERTFDLLTQVVGRAGRGKYKGKAIIQTHLPENKILDFSARQDYEGFYEEELQFRRSMLYPPFADIIVMGFVGGEEKRVKLAAELFTEEFRMLFEKEYSDLPVRVLSPSPASVVRVSNKFRYKIIIKCKNTPKQRDMISKLIKKVSSAKDYKEVTVYADVNPYIII